MLTVRDHARLRLAFELRGAWFPRSGRVRWELGETETAFVLRVNQLLDDERAIAAYPVETARLRRLRAARQAQRSARRLSEVVHG